MWLAVCLAIATSTATRAHASDAAPTLVIAAHSVQDERDAAVLRGVRAALSQFDTIELLPSPPLDLEAVQLAIDCPEENVRCLREVGRRMEARVLIVSAVKRGGGEVGLRLLHFDLESGAAPRTVVRLAAGSEIERALLDQIPDMLRELLQEEVRPQALAETTEEPLPAPSPRAKASSPTADTLSDAGGGPSLGPLLLGAGGLSALAAGFAFGALMNDSQSKYAARTVETQMQAEAAERDRSRGKRQALAANVLLGAGAAAVVVAGIWLALDAGGDDEPARAALLPALGPGSAGVSLLGTWEAKQ